jgi:short-subunit dehydrogenase
MKTVLISGASSGLGRSIALNFSKKNYQLILIGKTKKKLISLKKELSNTNNHYFSLDLEKEKNLIILINKLNKIKKADCIIHCMGGGFGIHEDLVSKKSFYKLFNSNLFNQSEINNIFIKKSIKLKNELKIFHISSVASLENVASVGYTTAKSALNIYTKILSKKMIHRKIFVKNLILGGFETPDNSFGRLKINNKKAYKNFIKKRMPLSRLSSAKEMIQVIEFLMDSASNVISGDILMDNGETNSFRN